MREILPGILEQDPDKAVEKLEHVKKFAKSIHIDLLDGVFASNSTLTDPAIFTPYTQDIFFEVHMMVANPASYLEAWSKAGFRRFIGHVEKMPDQVEFVAQAEALGEVGLALDLDTSVEAITVPYQDLDTVLVMSVKAGHSGQAFVAEALEKVKALAAHNLFPIEVDGGISKETIHTAEKAGATRFVATSALFQHGTIEENFTQLQTHSDYRA